MATALLLTAVPSVDAQRIAEGGFSLRELRAYGTSPENEATDTFAFGGGSLSQIASVRRLSGGRIAVLDAGFKKVAIFDSTGLLWRVIGRGHGSGPGEFIFPTAMAVRGDSIAVFDYSQNRVTLFDTAGRVLATVPTRRAKDIAIVDGQLWGTQMPGTSAVLWQSRFDRGVENSRDFLAFDRAHMSFNPRGMIARMGDAIEGSVLIAHERPGLWWEVDAQGRVVGPRGTDLLGGMRPFAAQGVMVPPGSADGIAATSERRVVILFSRFEDRGSNQRPRFAGRRLAVLDRQSGRQLGTATFAGLESPVTAISPGFRPNELFFAAYEPYPRVVLARIEEERP